MPLSTGAVVGIGIGVSVAAAGLVTISVYFFTRRRLYMKQQKRWNVQMQALQQDDGGSSSGAGTFGGPGGMVAVQTVTADGKPAVVMMTHAQAQQGTWGTLGGDVVGPSPVSTRSLKTQGWDVRSVSDYSVAGEENPRHTAATMATERRESLMAAVMAVHEVHEEAVTPVEEPRGGRTVTWYGRHSIYEMG